MFNLRERTRENALSRESLAGLGITPVSIDALLRSGQVGGWVCLDHDTLAGFSLGDRATGEVLVLAVRPDAECRGVGRTLLERVVADLRAAGHVRVWLATSTDHQVRSHGFYRALGWRPSGVRSGTADEILERLIE